MLGRRSPAFDRTGLGSHIGDGTLGSRGPESAGSVAEHAGTQRRGRMKWMAQPTVVGQDQSAGTNVARQPTAGDAETEAVGSLPLESATGSASLPSANGRDVAGKKAAASRSRARRPLGLSIERKFTDREVKPFDQIVWERRGSMISNPDGSQVFRMDGVEVPAGWSQLATDIVV